MSSIKKFLQCPICFDAKPGQKFNCESGHTICCKCCMKLSSCPLCHRPFTDSRNFALESLIDSISVTTKTKANCPFKEDGCTIISENLSFTTHHTAVCEFRTLYCGLDNIAECYQKPISYRDYFQHLKHKHEISGVDEYIGAFTKTDFCDINDTNIKFKPYYIKYDDIIFFRRGEITSGIIYWWFTLMGNEQLANKYKVTIESHVEAKDSVSANSKSKLIPSFKFRLPVHSFRKRRSEIFHTGLYACMSVYQISAFSKSNNRLITTKISISRKYDFVG